MRIKLTKTAQKDLSKLNVTTQKQIVKKLDYILKSPDPMAFSKRLVNNHKGGELRFRVGDYRLVFDKKADVIVILYIEHRKDVHRKK
jgi:mRNA interferase RelE/StbE